MWESCVVTKSGADLLGHLSGIELTGAKFGISAVPDTALAMQTDVSAPMGGLGITDFKRLDGGFAIVIRADNTGVEEEYTIKQIGLYAREKDSEEEILLALTQDMVGERIPTETDMPDFSLQFTMVLEVSNEAEITAIIDSSLAISREQAERMIQADIEPLKSELGKHVDDKVKHITAEERNKWNGKAEGSHTHTEFENHIKNTNNPHNVTKSQVGFGNVPNVSTNDQTPTYTVVETLAKLVMGEKLGVAFGKIAKAVDELIAHLADNVRHVTAAERAAWNGKAAGSHTHGAASSTSNGFMSAADKTKLDGIAEGANKYTHPATAGNKHIPAGGKSGQILRWSEDGTAEWGADNNTTYTAASAAPKAPGTAAVGTSAKYAREDHVHPMQTSVSGNAGTATKLAAARTVDGVSFDGSENINHYGTCSTAAATAAKVVALTGFVLDTGAEVTVKFTVTNTAVNPTLNVNNTGAKAVYYRGAAIAAGYLAANRTYTFRYNGTQYELVGDIDTNTTYAVATTAKNGLMSAADKTKLDGIAEEANNYTHPSYTARTGVPTANQTPSFGSTFSISQPVSDASGHITAMNTKTVKIPNTAASASAAGLMSAADKEKLDGFGVSRIDVTYGKVTISVKTSSGVAPSQVVTISHPIDFLLVQSNITGPDITPIGMLTSLNTSCSVSSTSVSFSGSANSATVTFKNNSNLSCDIFYTAIKLS